MNFFKINSNPFDETCIDFSQQNILGVIRILAMKQRKVTHSNIYLMTT